MNTETGIDITNYIEERAAGTVRVTRNSVSTGNFIYSRITYSVKTENGVPSVIANTPIVHNINLGSLIELEQKIVAEEARISSLRAQFDAIKADMTAA